MEQLISTGLQMMQIDLSIDKESLCVIRALNTISFDDLHKIICHKLSITATTNYTFFLPKSDVLIRKVTRSFDESSEAKIASYVQTGDMILYRIFRSEFHVRFSSMGIVDEAQAMDAKLLITQGKIKNMMRKESVTYRNHLSNTTAKGLYQLCDRLLDYSMFHYYPDHSFLMLHVKGMLQPIFIENQANQFLLYCFQDEESYRRFFCICKDTLPNQSLYKYKQATVIRFAKKPLASFSCHHYHDAYISFLDMQRGWEMDGITEASAKELIIILPLLLQSLQWMKDHPITFSPKREMMHIYEHGNFCKIEMQSFDTMVLPIVAYEKLHNIQPLCEKEKLSTFLELDYRFIRQPHKSDHQERLPYLLSVSALGPHIQSHYEHTFEKEQDIKYAFQDMLLNIIEEHGRPEKIKVKDRYVFSILEDMCHKLDMFVQIDPRLPYMESYYADNNRVIYDMELVEKEPENIKKAVVEQPLQHQYNRKRFKMKGYFN